jgi:hypothetical protein
MWKILNGYNEPVAIDDVELSFTTAAEAGAWLDTNGATLPPGAYSPMFFWLEV